MQAAADTTLALSLAITVVSENQNVSATLFAAVLSAGFGPGLSLALALAGLPGASVRAAFTVQPPPPLPPGAVAITAGGDTQPLSGADKAAIGLAIGLGAPLLFCSAALCAWLVIRGRRAAELERDAGATEAAESRLRGDNLLAEAGLPESSVQGLQQCQTASAALKHQQERVEPSCAQNGPEGERDLSEHGPESTARWTEVAEAAPEGVAVSVDDDGEPGSGLPWHLRRRDRPVHQPTSSARRGRPTASVATLPPLPETRELSGTPGVGDDESDDDMPPQWWLWSVLYPSLGTAQAAATAAVLSPPRRLPDQSSIEDVRPRTEDQPVSSSRTLVPYDPDAPATRARAPAVRRSAGFQRGSPEGPWAWDASVPPTPQSPVPLVPPVPPPMPLVPPLPPPMPFVPPVLPLPEGEVPFVWGCTVGGRLPALTAGASLAAVKEAAAASQPAALISNAPGKTRVGSSVNFSLPRGIELPAAERSTPGQFAVLERPFSATPRASAESHVIVSGIPPGPPSSDATAALSAAALALAAAAAAMSPANEEQRATAAFHDSSAAVASFANESRADLRAPRRFAPGDSFEFPSHEERNRGLGDSPWTRSGLPSSTAMEGSPKVSRARAQSDAGPSGRAAGPGQNQHRVGSFPPEYTLQDAGPPYGHSHLGKGAGVEDRPQKQTLAVGLGTSGASASESSGLSGPRAVSAATLEAGARGARGRFAMPIARAAPAGGVPSLQRVSERGSSADSAKPMLRSPQRRDSFSSSSPSPLRTAMDQARTCSARCSGAVPAQ